MVLLVDFFTTERWCKQGAPFSPYIIIICAEMLATKIRNSKSIKGDNIEGV